MIVQVSVVTNVLTAIVEVIIRVISQPTYKETVKPNLIDNESATLCSTPRGCKSSILNQYATLPPEEREAVHYILRTGVVRVTEL